MKAKEYLNRAYRIDCRINSRYEQLLRLKELARKTTVAYGTEAVDHSRKATSMEDVIVRIMQAEEKLDEEIDTLIDLKREIQKTIDLVADADCRVLLEMRYLCMKTWKEISLSMELCERQVLRVHKDALKMVDTVLRTKEDGKIEERRS